MEIKNQEFSLIDQAKNKISSYWNRPGGKFGTLLGYGILGFLGFKIYTVIVPYVIKALDDTTELFWGLTKATATGALCAFVVGGIIYALMSPRFRAGIVAVWEKIFINSWLSWFIKTNPKDIAKGRIEEFEEERERFASKSEEIQGALVSTESEIQSINSKINTIDKKIRQVSNTAEAGVLARERGYLVEWQNKLLPLEKGLKKTLEACNKIYENSGYMLQDMKNQFDYTVRMYESTTKASSALKSALSMFSGKGAKSQLGEEAMYFMEQSISQNIGSMRQDMRSIDKFVGSIDLQNKVYEADGLELIKQLNPELYKHFQTLPAAQTIDVEAKVIDGKYMDSGKYSNLI